MENDTKSILEEAAEIRSGSRNADYGDAAENFKRIAQIASLITGQVVDPKTCVAVHIATKLSREAHRHKRDNLVDLCGYADILQRIHESEDRSNQGKSEETKKPKKGDFLVNTSYDIDNMVFIYSGESMIDRDGKLRIGALIAENIHGFIVNSQGEGPALGLRGWCEAIFKG